jgi:hypothetical protein
MGEAVNVVLVAIGPERSRITRIDTETAGSLVQRSFRRTIGDFDVVGGEGWCWGPEQLDPARSRSGRAAVQIRVIRAPALGRRAVARGVC